MTKSKKTFLTLLIFCNLYAQDWVQIGSNIIGETAGDNFSQSVSLSSDGNALAIGDPTVGQVGINNLTDGGNYDFSNTNVGSYTDVIFTVENTGISDLSINTPINIIGTDADQFSIQEQPTPTVSASNSTTITIRFAPTSAGEKTANIAIINNDIDENPYELTLNGPGVEGAQPHGSGTYEDPYQVSILDHLLWISTQPSSWDKYFEQTNNIDASPTAMWNPDGVGGYYGFSPIGKLESNYIFFTGSYNGQFHTIDGLYINRTSNNYVGLFGMTNSAEIKNLGVTNINITGNNVPGTATVGGLVGYCILSSVVSNCYATGTMNSGHYTGGLIGWLRESSIISNSYSTGTVNGASTGFAMTGGLVGYSSTSTTVSNSYSTCSVSNSGTFGSVGGLVGVNVHTSIVSNCYATGIVVSGGIGPYIGGLVGRIYSTGTVANSFWDIETSGLSGIDDGVGDATRAVSNVYGKTTVEMKDLATYTDETTAGLDTAWDFVSNPNDDVANDNYWDICTSINSRYPILSWQNGDEVCLGNTCVNGSIIYNTETNKFNFCENGIWVEK